eukprot:3389479-Amphidinium_carterae.1
MGYACTHGGPEKKPSRIYIAFPCSLPSSLHEGGYERALKMLCELLTDFQQKNKTPATVHIVAASKGCRLASLLAKRLITSLDKPCHADFFVPDDGTELELLGLQGRLGEVHVHQMRPWGKSDVLAKHNGRLHIHGMGLPMAPAKDLANFLPDYKHGLRATALTATGFGVAAKTGGAKNFETAMQSSGSAIGVSAQKGVLAEPTSEAAKQAAALQASGAAIGLTAEKGVVAEPTGKAAKQAAKHAAKQTAALQTAGVAVGLTSEKG